MNIDSNSSISKRRNDHLNYLQTYHIISSRSHKFEGGGGSAEYVSDFGAKKVKKKKISEGHWV